MLKEFKAFIAREMSSTWQSGLLLVAHLLRLSPH